MSEVYAITVRPARASDAERLGAISHVAWRLAYAGLIPEASLRGLIQARRASAWTQRLRGDQPVLVLTLGDVVAGYAQYGLARRRGPFRGELFELYFDPPYQGLGLGSALFASVRERLVAAGAPGLVVWALEENATACAFYAGRGGTVVAREAQTFSGRSLTKLAYGFR